MTQAKTTTARIPEQKGGILIPRDRAVNQIIGHLQQVKHLPLITINGPSGIGKSDLAGPLLIQKIQEQTGKSAPVLLHLSLRADEPAVNLAEKIADFIIEHHPEFQARKESPIFRDKILRSVRRSPSEAAERLRTMMREAEKGKAHLNKIQLVFCLDDADKLFESRVRCGADISKTVLCGDEEDPVGFLSKLLGMNTILFSIVHRSWVSREIRSILDSGEIGEEMRFDVNLSYPDGEEVEDIVKTMLKPIRETNLDHTEIDQFSVTITETLKKNPAAIGALPETLKNLFRDRDGGLARAEDCVDRFRVNGGFAGDLAKKAEAIFLKQNPGNKLALEEVFTNLIKGDGRILIKGAVMSEELWAIALNFVENRILALDGRSYRNARFVLTHEGILSSWTRALAWAQASRRVGLSQLRNLDDRALSWELGERKKSLLIECPQTLETARLVLSDPELVSQLSSLTRTYLNRSLKPKREPKDILLSKIIWVPVGALFAGFFLFCLVIILLPEEGEHPTGSAAPVAAVPVQPVPTPSPVTKPILEEIKVAPINRELLASADILSESKVPEGVPLLSESELFQDAIHSKGAEFDQRSSELVPVSEEEIIQHISGIMLKDTAENQAPILLPAAMFHLKPKIDSGDSRRTGAGIEEKRLKVGGPTISSGSSWRGILNQMGTGIAEQSIATVLESLRHFHEKTILYPREIKNIQLTEFKDLVSHLGKIALLQNDQLAMRGAWKLELIAQNRVEMGFDLQCLMARIALNAGHHQEAVAYFSQSEVENQVNPAAINFMKAAIVGHFKVGETGKSKDSRVHTPSSHASIE